MFSSHHAFVGINDIAFVGGTAQYRECTAGQFAANGVGWFRYPLTWAYVETSPGVFNFSVYDSLIALLARHHIRYLPVLLQPPSWAAVGGAAVNPTGIAPPAHPEQFAQFAAAVVRRYGPHGSFWKQYPTLPKIPIRDWQIWNEPNLPGYWEPNPSPVAYTRLLKAAYMAIKRVDPHADVITAGMPYYGPRQTALNFYRGMLRAGAGRFFDSFAFNAYAKTPAQVLKRSLAVRSLLNRHGAAKKAMWVTEFGWASGGPHSPYNAGTPRAQAGKLSRVFTLFSRNRKKLGLRGAMLWSWTDQPLAEAKFDYWGLHCGLYTLGLKAKPALRVLSRAAKALSR